MVTIFAAGCIDSEPAPEAAVDDAEVRELERRLDIVIGSLQYHLHYLERK